MFAAIGITNQRETTIVWDRETGLPLYNAVGLYTCSYYFAPCWSAQYCWQCVCLSPSLSQKPNFYQIFNAFCLWLMAIALSSHSFVMYIIHCVPTATVVVRLKFKPA